MAPSKTAQNTWQSVSGEDFLQVVNSQGGGVLGGIDSTGTGYGSLTGSGGGFTPPPTKALYVDNSRTDSYTADGSLLKPFKTIMGAVNQVVTNGDNSTNQYVIWVNPGTYAETIDLSNSALVNLTFIGYGVIVNTGNAGDALKAVGNDNLTDVKMVGFKFFTTAGNQGITFSSTTNGTNFLNGNVYTFGLWFRDCFVYVNAINVTNAGGVFFDGSHIAGAVTANNVSIMQAHACFVDTSASGWAVNTNAGNPKPSGFSNSNLYIRWCNFADSVNIGAGSNSNLYWSRFYTTVTLNGTGIARGSAITTVTVNSGGSYSERESAHVTLTVNAGGTYSSVSETAGCGSLILSGAAPTVPASTVGLGNGTAATASAGAGSLPAAPDSFLIVNVGGTVKKIPLYLS